MSAGNGEPTEDETWNDVCRTLYSFPKFRKLSHEQQNIIINNVFDSVINLMKKINGGTYPWNKEDSYGD